MHFGQASPITQSVTGTFETLSLNLLTALVLPSTKARRCKIKSSIWFISAKTVM